MGNKQSAKRKGQEPSLPRLAKGEPVDVLRQNKWHSGKISKVDDQGNVTVTFQIYNVKKEVTVARKEYEKKLAKYGTKAGEEGQKKLTEVEGKEEKTNGVPVAAVVDGDDDTELEAAEMGSAVDYLDVLDTSKAPTPFDPFHNLHENTSETPPPTGGWIWRPAKVESVQGETATVRFLDNIDGYEKLGSVDIDDESRVASYRSKSAGGILYHSYEVGDPLDVEDHFRRRGTNQVGKKWRKCQVTRVTPYYIRVHFVGWASGFDEWFHVLQQKDRLAEFGSHTEKELMSMDKREETFLSDLRKQKNLTVHFVDPDGNCLFRAVAHQVYGDVERHDIVRSDCMDYIVKNRDRFEVLLEAGQFDSYVEEKRVLGVWGDDAEIRAIEELYDRPIQIYSVNSPTLEPLKIHFDDDLPSDKMMGHYEPIRISFHGQNHYNSIIPFVSRTVRDGGKNVEEDISAKVFNPPPLRLNGIIRKFRRVGVKRSFRLDMNHLEAENESKET